LDVDDVSNSLSLERVDANLASVEKGCREPKESAYVKYTEVLEIGTGPN